MLVEFPSLPGSSRVWVYQSSRLLNQDEQQWLLDNAQKFVSDWTAHQAGLKAGVHLESGLFLAFAVDESYNGASGCSIDKKVAFLKSAENYLGNSFFERMNFAWITVDNEIRLSRLQDLPKLMESGDISESTTVYNNLVATMNEFRNRWKEPLGKTWMMQFAGKVTN
jgi:hypothetical protein